MKEIKTLATLLKIVKENLEKYNNLDLVEEYTCVELVDDDMLETIEKLKIELVVDALDYNLIGTKKTIAQVKKEALKNS